MVLVVRDSTQGREGERFIVISTHTYVQVNTDGLLSFGEDLPGIDFNPGQNITFPIPSSSEIGRTPFLAPLWSSLHVSDGGNVSYRQSKDPSLIGRALGVWSAERNATVEVGGGGRFVPSLVVVATWSEVALRGSGGVS